MVKNAFSTWISVSIAATFILAAAGGVYGYYYMTSLTDRVARLEGTLASTTALLINTIEETQTSLSDTLTQEKRSLEERLGDISGTVTTLEKLSKTDPELLQKYSKVYFLNEHYVPERLVEIADTYEYSEAEHNMLHAQVYPYLKRMLEAAKDDEIELYVSSAYRSFTEQDNIKSGYTVVYGAGTANSFSADQGYSEHQLGTTVDFTTVGLNGGLAGFDKTEAYEWLVKNAHRWGFVLSYPKNNPYYIYEPWHWRFVGEDLADDLHDKGKSFYDLEQREIDEYLVSLFD